MTTDHDDSPGQGAPGRPRPGKAPTKPHPFGVALRAARIERGWTQRQLADEAGISHRAVSYYEAGRVPALDEALRLARVVGLSLDDLSDAPNTVQSDREK